MKKIIVLTLLMGLVCTPVFATDWDEFESGRRNIVLTGYQSQPAYIEFQDGDGNTLVYLYWNEDYDEFFAITPDEWDTDGILGTPYGSTSKNVGVAIDGTPDTTGGW